jgi:hypothetical protein
MYALPDVDIISVGSLTQVMRVARRVPQRAPCSHPCPHLGPQNPMKVDFSLKIRN